LRWLVDLPKLGKVKRGGTWQRFAVLATQLVRRNWQTALKWRERVRISEDAFHLLVAGMIGLDVGLCFLAFHGSYRLLQYVAWGTTGPFLEIVTAQPAWKLALVPAVGGLIAGLILWFGLRLLASPGLTNLLEVVVAGDGRLPLRAGLVTAASSLVSIATGACIGREGLMVQLSATLASKMGQLAQWPPYRLRLMVACGAAAGLSCALNAPIAGSLFAAQIVLGSFSMGLFAPTVVASVVAVVVSRTFYGAGYFYEVPPEFDFTKVASLPWFLLLGVMCGIMGGIFLKLLRWSDAFCGRLTVPLYVRLALGGLAVGCLAVAWPEVLGNGYDGTNRILHDLVAGRALAGVFLARLAATVIAVGVGTVGGVFTPTLFLGAALGAMLGGLLQYLGMPGALPPGAFALVGMGAMLAATTHSPLLAIIAVFELSGKYEVMPPLMLACVVATLVARRLHRQSVYTEPLRRKGLTASNDSLRASAAMERRVGDLMRQPVPPVRETASFQEIAERFLTNPNNFLPVVNAEGRLLGVVALHDLKEHLHAGQELAGVIAYDLLRPPPPSITPDMRLSDTLPILVACEMRRVPVVNDLREQRLIGTLLRAEALGLLSEAIATSGNQA
jgi:chloride channel protein, CIC family